MAMDTTDAPQVMEHIHKPLNLTPHEARWVPASARLVTCGINSKNKGELVVHEMSKGTIVERARYLNQNGGIKCGTFGASRLEERHFAFGDYSGRLTICDLERGPDEPIYSVSAHDNFVNAVDGFGGMAAGCGAPEIATAGRDGCVRIWDPRSEKPVLSLEPTEGQSSRDCWAVSIGNSYNELERCVCAGYDNGDLKMFDLRTNKMRWETNCGDGVTSIDFDRKDIEMNKLVVTTLESKLRLYDLRTQVHVLDQLKPTLFF
mmetsp:Transcript_28675/g.65520  ORF Transcript_28675/g.65520 Transcript_28675/m.65520 type:complete len:261 (-) Transcript_28675:809-1591(-)